SRRGDGHARRPRGRRGRSRALPRRRPHGRRALPPHVRRDPRRHEGDRTMTAIVLRGLAARKLRTALTALAIVLGAAMVTGTLVMGHTVRSGFHEWYTKANGNSAAVITGHLTVRDDNSDVGTATPPLPASLVAKVRNVPGVAHAEGLVQG